MSVRTMLWLALAACGGGSESPGVDPDASETPPVDAGPDLRTLKTGAISVIEGKLVLVGGTFQTVTDIELRTEGPCAISRQFETSVATPLSAGIIQVSSGATTITLQPDDQLIYSGELQQAFPPGSIVTVAAAGNAAPAFTGTVAVPTTTLQLTSTLPTIVRKSQGFTASWTPASDGTVALVVLDRGPAVSTAVVCQFPASAGGGTIPASALADLTVGAEVGLVAEMLGFTELEEGEFRIGLAVLRNFVSAEPVVAD